MGNDGASVSFLGVNSVIFLLQLEAKPSVSFLGVNSVVIFLRQLEAIPKGPGATGCVQYATLSCTAMCPSINNTTVYGMQIQR